MENASKALIMAAGMLIGMLILSLAVYLFVSFGNTSAEVYKKNEENQLNKFNTQFTSYVGTELTIYDVVTILNRATENNVFYELVERRNETINGNDNYIGVIISGKGRKEYGFGGTSQEERDQDYNNLIMEDINEIKDQDGKRDLPKYTCTVEISPTTQRVYFVNITKK